MVYDFREIEYYNHQKTYYHIKNYTKAKKEIEYSKSLIAN